MEITIIIPGKPIGKARPRFARRGKFVTAYNCQETEEGRFKWELCSRVPKGFTPIPAGVPIHLTAHFYMPIPSSMSKKALKDLSYRHIKKPDLDNLLKFLKDCGNGVLWADDSQVCEVSAWKGYHVNPQTFIVLKWDSEADKRQSEIDEAIIKETGI